MAADSIGQVEVGEVALVQFVLRAIQARDQTGTINAQNPSDAAIPKPALVVVLRPYNRIPLREAPEPGFAVRVITVEVRVDGVDPGRAAVSRRDHLDVAVPVVVPDRLCDADDLLHPAAHQ